MRLYFNLIFLFILSFVGEAQPNWNDTPNAYSYTSNWVIHVVHGNELIENIDSLAVFKGNELRGVTGVVDVNGKKLFYLTVRSNKFSDEVLTLKFFDGSDNIIFDLIDSIDFHANEIKGSASEPKIFHTDFQYDIPTVWLKPTKQLIEIGDSFSVVALNDYCTSPDGDNISYSVVSTAKLNAVLKNDSLSVTLISSSWKGKDSIRVVATEDGIHTHQREMYIVYEVTDLDYPPVWSVISEQQFTPTQSFFSLSLSTLLINEDQDPITYEAHPVLETGNESFSNPYVPTNQFTSSMNFVVEATIYSLPTSNQNMNLVAKVNGEVRGWTASQIIGSQYVFFLTVYGESGDEIEFELFDAGRNYTYHSFFIANYETNANWGTVSNPYVIDFGSVSFELNGDLLIAEKNTGISSSAAVKIIATENTSLSKSDTTIATFSIIQDFPPVISPMPLIILEENDPLPLIDLDTLITEPDGQDYTVSIQNGKIFSAFVQNNVLHFSFVNPAGFGLDTLILSVTDQGSYQLSSTPQFIIIQRLNQNVPVSWNFVSKQLSGQPPYFADIDLTSHLVNIDDDDVYFELFLPKRVQTNPNWQNPEGFQHTHRMVITVEPKIGNLDMANFQLSSWIQNELRGTAIARKVSEKWIFDLSVHSNNFGDTITFQLYDSINNRIQMLDTTRIFVPGVNEGSGQFPIEFISSPLQFNLDNGILQTNILQEDWFGIDTVGIRVLENRPINAKTDDLLLAFEVLKDDVPVAITPIPDQIMNKGESFSVVNLNHHFQSPDGDDLIYRLVAANSNLTVSLTADNFLEVEPVFSEWIGTGKVVLKVEEKTTNKLSVFDTISYTILDEDINVTLGGVPIFISPYQEVTGSFDISPYLKGADKDTLHWEVQEVFLTVQSNSPFYDLNPSNFPANMNLIVKIQGLEGNQSMNDELFAFSGDEIRGKAYPQIVDNEWLYFLTIYGHENGEQIHFKWYNKLSAHLFSVTQTTAFEQNQIVGSIQSPFNFTRNIYNISYKSPAYLEWIEPWPSYNGKFMLTAYNSQQQILDTTFFVIRQHDQSLTVSAIPDQTIEKGEEFQPILLNQYVLYSEVDSVKWEVIETGELIAFISQGQLTVLTPNEDWTGQQNVKLRVSHTSSINLQDTITVEYTVLGLSDNIPKIIGMVSDTIIEPKTDFSVLLTPYIQEFDGDHFDIQAELIGNGLEENNYSIPNYQDFEFNMGVIAKVVLDGVVVKDSDYELLILFKNEVRGVGTLSDLLGGDVFSATVYGDKANEPMFFALRQKSTGMSYVINEAIYFQPNYQYGSYEFPLELNVGTIKALTIRNDTLMFSSQNKGRAVMKLKITDLGTVKQFSSEVVVQITVQDLTPLKLSNTENIATYQGMDFSSVSLASILDGHWSDDIFWEAKSDQLIVSFNSSEMQILKPFKNWVGSDKIVIWAVRKSSPQSFDSVSFFASSVVPPTDSIKLNNFPDLLVYADQALPLINGLNFLMYPFSSIVNWSVSANEIEASINNEGIITLAKPNSQWFGSDSVCVTAKNVLDSGNKNSTCFTVTVDHRPIHSIWIDEIENQIITDEENFPLLDISEFITFAYTNQLVLELIDANIPVTINNKVVEVRRPNNLWTGIDTLKFKLRDVNNPNVDVVFSVIYIALQPVSVSEDLKEITPLIYPNPTSSILHVKGYLNRVESIHLLDQLGNKLLSENVAAVNDILINVNDFPSSIYTLMFLLKDGSKKFYKVMKQ